MNDVPPPVAALQPVAEALDSLGVEYHIGGSIASSFHGRARSTMNVDLVADLKLPHIEPLVALLEKDYYIDGEMIADAIREQTSFNVIHLGLAFKVDVFVAGSRPYDVSARQRVVQGELPGDPRRTYPIAAAEDLILNKLSWYRLGGETSERQWRDVIEVLQTQDDRLDRAYMTKWAASLNVSDLLERAFDDAVIED